MNWLEKAWDTFLHGSVDEPATAETAKPITLDKIRDAQAAYHLAITLGTATEAELAELSADIRTAQREVSDAITAGSKPCRKCGNLPLGMRRGNGKFEIGCLHCNDWRALGDTQTEAVQNWNEQRG